MRTTWTGSISWGMVTIPVKLYKAVSEQRVSFRQLNEQTGNRVSQKRVDSVTGEEVPYANIVKGYELDKDTHIVILDDELNALRPEAAKTIAIEKVVPRSEIPQVIGDQSYFIAPEKVGKKAYALFASALGDDIAIGRFVMRQVEYLTAISVDADGVLVATRLRYDDEINDASTIPTVDSALATIAQDLTVAEQTMAAQLIDGLRGHFDHSEYVDDYRLSVLNLIENKTEGITSFPVTDRPVSPSVTDLMAQLEASVEAAKSARNGSVAAQKEVA